MIDSPDPAQTEPSAAPQSPPGAHEGSGSVAAEAVPGADSGMGHGPSPATDTLGAPGVTSSGPGGPDDAAAPAARLAVGDSERDAVDDQVDEAAPHGRCQFCREPLPEPRRRQDGKYKGGRRRLYCPAPRDCKER